MKRLFLIFLFLLISCPAWGATYYMRADGTAATIGASTGGCSDATSCMSVSGHNSFTITSGSTITLCDTGGNYSAQVNVKPGVTYIAETGQSPTWNMGGANSSAFYSITSNNVTIDGITALNSISEYGIICGVFVHDWVVKNCNLSSNNGRVLMLSGNTSSHGYHNVRNNIITATSIGASAAIDAQSYYVVIDNNTITNSTSSNPREQGYGILIGRYGTVKNNTIGTTASNGFMTGIRTDSSYVIVEHNDIGYAWNGLDYNHGGKGVGVHIGGSTSRDNITRYNYIHDCQRGYLEDEAVNNANGNNQVLYNLFVNNTANGIDVRYAGTGTVPSILNNTVIHHIYPDQTTEANSIGHGIAVQNGGVGAIIKNNIVVSDQHYDSVQGMYLNDLLGGISNVTLDNNLYYATNGAHIASYNADDYTTLDSWKTKLASVSGVKTKEPNSINSDPLFISATNYHLQSGSPARGAGVNVGLSNTNPPDIGAEPYRQYVPWR